MATRREKLTVELEPELRASLTRWAAEEERPVGNLLRRIVAEAVRRKFPAGAPPHTPFPPARTPMSDLDEARAKLATLAAERTRLMKRDGPPGPPSRHLSLREQARLSWLHNEVADLERDVRRLEVPERAAAGR